MNHATLKPFVFPTLVVIALIVICWGMYREDMANQDEQKPLERSEIAATNFDDRVAARDTGIRYGKKKDYAKSAKFFEKAARLNDSDSYMVLGLYYCLGLGVEQDNEKGIEFMKRAVILGWDQPKNPLAGVKEFGLDGIRKDGSLKKFLVGHLVSVSFYDSLRACYFGAHHWMVGGMNSLSSVATGLPGMRPFPEEI